jgi:translation initiation factor IF-2
VLRTLTDEERNRRAHALGDARLREAEERKIAEEEAERRATREKFERVEREAAESRKREEDDRRKHDDETKRKADEVAKKRFGAEVTAPGARPPGGRMAPEAEDDDAPRTFRRGAGGVARPAPAPKVARTRVTAKPRGRLTLVTALSADEERERSQASFIRRTKRRMKELAVDEPKEKIVREVTIPEFITIQELANRMAERAVDVIKLLMKQGQMAQINDVIDADTAQLVAEARPFRQARCRSDVEEGVFDTADDPAALVQRTGDDHGPPTTARPSLLDAIRSTNVAGGEVSITQHRRHQVTSPSHSKITFIDTPGHAAFTAMRARGAKVTDIVMPRSLPTASCRKRLRPSTTPSREVPMIVAINKIDKADAKSSACTELLQHEVQVELGRRRGRRGNLRDQNESRSPARNDRLAGRNSRSQGQSGPSRQHRHQAKLDRGRGPVATVLVQRARYASATSSLPAPNGAACARS